MKITYLIYAFIAFIGYMVLHWVGTQFKWMALGFGVIMLILGIFMKTKKKPIEAEVKAEEMINEVNKMGENQNLNKMGVVSKA